MSDFIKNMSDKIEDTAEKAGMKSTGSAGTNLLTDDDVNNNDDKREEILSLPVNTDNAVSGVSNTIVHDSANRKRSNRK